MKRLFLILVLCVVVLSSTFAQTLSNRERRNINYRVLQAVEQYESLLSLNSDDVRTEFIYLFDKENVDIYNDILGFHMGSNKLPLKTYVDFLAKQRNVISKIKNLKKVRIERRSDGWHAIVEFDKTLLYVDNNRVLFSSEEYHGADYKITMDLRYDNKDDRCYISSISGSIQSEKSLPDKFVVIDKASEAVYKKMYGKVPTFNSYDQAFVASIDDSRMNIDEHFQPTTKIETETYKYLELDYGKTPGRIKTRFAITPGKAFKVKSPVAFSKHKSLAMEFSVDLGAALPLGKSSTIGLFAGAGLSRSSLSLEQNNMEYSCNIGVNKETGELITRKYNLSASEGVSYVDVIVPLYIAFEHCLVKNVLHLVWNIGTKMYFNIKQLDNVTPFRLTGTITQGTSTVELDNVVYTSFIHPNSYSIAKPFSLPSISAVAGLGFNFNIYKRRIFANMQVGYEYGFAKIHTSKESKLFDDNAGIYPLVPSGSDINANVATRSFLDCISYRRQALWLEAGLMFKF